MATTKPRITITLEQADYDVLKRLNKLNGVPMSKTISEFVSLTTPVLSQIADNLERLAESDRLVKDGLSASLESMLTRTQALYVESQGILDEMTAEISEAVDGENGRAERATRGSFAQASARGDCSAQPPYSNTGVRDRKSESGQGVI